MARPLRIERPGGRYHVTARGNERKAIYRTDEDRFHFLAVLAEAVERFGVGIHAYVLMDNHFHLLLATPEANLSAAMQWVNVSYSVWFNLRHDRSGHLFQGRFKAVVVEDDAGWQVVARYVHLNPVRVARLGLDKQQQAGSRQGIGQAPSPELVGRRLQVLREWRWSSYPAYAGYRAPLDWLTREPLARLCGGRTDPEQRQALRQYTEAPLRQGTLECPWDRLIASLVLGSEAFVARLRQEIKGDRGEQTELRRLEQQLSWEQIVHALEQGRGESWEAFRDRHGDWGRDAALWLGRKRGRLSLRQLGDAVGGVAYGAVGQAVKRFDQRLESDAALRRQVNQIKNMLNV
jgi:putative transposase